MLQSTPFRDFTDLGDFVISLASKELFQSSFLHFLSPKIAEATNAEILEFLRYILKDITGEKSLTWNLVDAVDMFLVTGCNSHSCILFIILKIRLMIQQGCPINCIHVYSL